MYHDRRITPQRALGIKYGQVRHVSYDTNESINEQNLEDTDCVGAVVNLPQWIPPHGSPEWGHPGCRRVAAPRTPRTPQENEYTPPDEWRRRLPLVGTQTPVDPVRSITTGHVLCAGLVR